MSDIFFDFIVDYGKHRKTLTSTQYDIIVYELQAFHGSGISNKTNEYYLKNNHRSAFRKLLFQLKNKKSINKCDTTAVSYLFHSKNVFRDFTEYQGTEEYKRFLNKIIKSNYSNLTKAFESVSPDFHKNNIEYLSANNSFLNFSKTYQMSGRYTTSKLILQILDNKILQRILLNNNIVTRNYIPKCFILSSEDIRIYKKELIQSILDYFSPEENVVFKIDECLGQGNYFVNLKNIKNNFDKSSFFQNVYFQNYSYPTLVPKLILVEAISNIGTLSRIQTKNDTNTYRAAVVYHKDKSSNKIKLFNTTNIHLDKTDQKEPDSHKWSIGHHFALENPRVLERKAKPGISYQDAGNDSDYEYHIQAMDKDKAMRNKELFIFKKDLYEKFFHIANLLGNYKTDSLLQDTFYNFIENDIFGKIQIANISKDKATLNLALETIYSYREHG